MLFIKITTSYKVKLKDQINLKTNKNMSLDKASLDNTIKIYREALLFVIDAVNKEWDVIEPFGKMGRKVVVERLIHSTKDRIAKYDFDSKFYKFPSYFRRSVISTAIGIVSAYKSSLENWEKAGKVTKEPQLNLYHFEFPAFYKGNCFTKETDTIVSLKVYKNNDWVWVSFTLKETDVKYILRHCSSRNELCPILCKIDKNYYLRFVFEEEVKLPRIDETDAKILAVDLGLNHDAVMCVMDSVGTVYARKFVKIAYEKDQLNHVLNQIKRDQKKYGYMNQRLWRKANNLNDQIGEKTSLEIINFALLHQVDYIVFEHLDLKGKKHGKMKQKLSLWRAQQIQAIVGLKAHQNRIRISRVCAYNASKLAYDGSGIVERDKKNYSLCTFTTKKKYNCDLNATYNIGARFFLRVYDKKAKEENKLKIKTSERTLQTLKDYLNPVYNK